MLIVRFVCLLHPKFVLLLPPHTYWSQTYQLIALWIHLQYTDSLLGNQTDKLVGREITPTFLFLINKSMEYSVLGLQEGASMDSVQRALRKIRAKYHPDKHMHVTPEHRDQMRHTVSLAEEAFDRLQKKEAVNMTIQNVLSPLRGFQSTFHTPSSANVHTETYTYSNINGQVRERRTVNGTEYPAGSRGR